MKQADFESFAKNAKLRLTQPELQEMLSFYMDIKEDLLKIKNCTCEAEPLVTVCKITDIMREDIVEKLIGREELLSCAIEENNGYFQVPKTLE